MKIAAWSNQHAAALRHFLEQPIGKDFIESLKMRYGKLKGDNFEQGALNAAFREGQEDIVETAIDELRNWDEKPDVNLNAPVNTNDGPR